MQEEGSECTTVPHTAERAAKATKGTVILRPKDLHLTRTHAGFSQKCSNLLFQMLHLLLPFASAKMNYFFSCLYFSISISFPFTEMNAPKSTSNTIFNFDRTGTDLSFSSVIVALYLCVAVPQISHLLPNVIITHEIVLFLLN